MRRCLISSRRGGKTEEMEKLVKGKDVFIPNPKKVWIGRGGKNWIREMFDRGPVKMWKGEDWKDIKWGVEDQEGGGICED